MTELNLAKGAVNRLPNGLCFTCRKKLPLDNHHIIPVSYGGQEGPTVDLCQDCHTLVHRLILYGVRQVSKPENIQRDIVLDALGKIGRNARKLSTKQERPQRWQTTFKPETANKLDKLAQITKRSKHDIVANAIDTLYNQLT